MLKSHSFLLGLLLVAGGCSTGLLERAPDWRETPANDAVEIEHVSEGPQVAAAATALNVPSVRPPFNSDTWVSLNRWSQDNNLGQWHPVDPASPRAFALNTTNGELIVQPRSTLAHWNGTELRLGFEPQLIEDQPFVHVLDLNKNIKPLLRDFAVTTRTNRVIVIDAGHGGANGGTTSIEGVKEKEFTLDWALRLEPLLAANGWQVFLTRTNDTDISLSNRVAFAEEHQADLFISLHFNSAAPSREQSGLETFCLTPTGMRSTLVREFEDNTTLTFPNNAFDAENLQYGLLLHRALLKCGFADRGVRRARFPGVLRGQKRPAILIEGGFLSNPHEAENIANPDFRQKMAQAIADALK